ncbi:sigma-70 family RNA polymerase sigma factor [Gemmata sp. JC717]|uniref:sigma-70 family RNA polymerase sigma factor n=1 Tax=Gemmata algarum TaxID=2975278 RepID=UPI0021BB7167|nr:sigma-70 family RNA polymerase sigma factor [Gemmata algarum]MDY3555743.1 sigma-70 family RNA polymerase sigma factor [Gemmata algarum]
MSHALSALMAQTARAVAPDTDGQLLKRFVRTGDEAAFAELVRRLGPLVLGVCRRIVPDAHTAEDAFQAAFLVLARRAADVRPVEAVRGWLYGVAVRCAKEARAVNARRRAREVPVPNVPEQPAEPDERADADVLHALDEEMTQLPEHLRTAVVLCELEGLSRKEAAGRLGLSEGTLSSRLAKARKLLAHRLRERGVTLSAAGLSAALSATAQARVPADLTAQALAAALFPALGPVSVVTLSTRVLKAMLVQKLKTVLPLAALALAALACVGLAATQEPPALQPKTALAPRAAQPAPKVAPRPLPKGPDELLYWNEGKLVLTTPDGKATKTIGFEGVELHQRGGQLSPDGKTLAYLASPKLKKNEVNLGEFKATTRPQYPQLHVRALDDRGPGTSLGTACESFVWSPDGTEIACSTLSDKPGQQPVATTVIVNVKSKEKSPLKLPANHAVTDWAPDGRLLTTSFSGTDAPSAKARLHLMNRDGTEHKALAPDTNAMMGQISPDGARVLCVLLTFATETAAEKKAREDKGERFPEPQSELAVLDIAAGTFTKVRDVPANADIFGYCWAPTGKQIAYTWRQKHEGKPEDIAGKETESRLIVCDPDGQNAKTVASAKETGQWHITLSGVHWR